jgi:Zn-dependent protease
MGTDYHELQRMGKTLYPEIAQFAEVTAVYHRGPDIIFEIKPKISHEVWLKAVKSRFFDLGFHMRMYERDGSFVIVAKDIRPEKSRVPWVNIVLAVLTVFSMILTYGYLEYGRIGDDLFNDVGSLMQPVWFMLALMLILACHEFGHYFAAKHHKADVSLPYFIPAPTLFGTFGAFIRSRSPFKNRIELFDVGVAGPLAGFVPALIILTIGMANVEFQPVAGEQTGEQFLVLGNSLILMVLEQLVMPVPPEGYRVIMSPLMFAGWIGLFVTMANLLPMGQLDGGHIMYALVGKRWQRIIAKHPPTLDDTVSIGQGRRRLGWLSVVIFVVTFMPLPLGQMTL